MGAVRRTATPLRRSRAAKNAPCAVPAAHPPPAASSLHAVETRCSSLIRRSGLPAIHSRQGAEAHDAIDALLVTIFWLRGSSLSLSYAMCGGV